MVDTLNYWRCWRRSAAEPYRYLMKNHRSRLMAVQAWLEARLKVKIVNQRSADTRQKVAGTALKRCQSLQACNGCIVMAIYVYCAVFGMPLVRDIRRESTRHTEAW